MGWLLPIVCAGLCETAHPYSLIAKKAFPELLAECPQATLLPLIPSLIQPLRAALLDPAAGIFEAGCDAIIALSIAAGPYLNPHIEKLLQQINKKSMQAKYKQKVQECIQTLVEQGGDEAIAVVKARVPGFTI